MKDWLHKAYSKVTNIIHLTALVLLTRIISESFMAVQVLTFSAAVSHFNLKPFHVRWSYWSHWESHLLTWERPYYRQFSSSFQPLTPQAAAADWGCPKLSRLFLKRYIFYHKCFKFKNGGFMIGMSTTAKTNDLAFGSWLQMRHSTVAAIGYISVMVLNLMTAFQENTNLKKL